MPCSCFLDEIARRGVAAPADLQVRVDALVQRARTAWQGVTLDEATFLTYLAARWPQCTSLEDWLSNEHASDLYLACACAHGNSAAIAVFDRAYLSKVPLFLARAKPNASFVDDVCQSMREKLFVGDRRKISEYSGGGALGAWVRTVVKRTAIDLRRQRGERLFDEPVLQPDVIDPEFGYIAEIYRSEVEEALRRAVTVLTGEQRTLFRMRFVDSITLDELARFRRVSRSTIVRQLESAKLAICAEVRRLLGARLEVSADELTSLIRLVRSGIEMSLVQLLSSQVVSRQDMPPNPRTACKRMK